MKIVAIAVVLLIPALLVAKSREWERCHCGRHRNRLE